MAPKPKLTPEKIAEIQALSGDGLTQVEIAAKLKINRDTVAKALSSTFAAAGSSSADLVMLEHSQIIQAAFNPRNTFPKEELLELAESINAKGLLQNLVVRKIEDGGGLYELVAGERRWRAIAELIRDFRWNGPIACRVVDADNAEHLSLSIIENLQRQDVPPLEEADAFVQLQGLDPKTWTAAAIAKAISRTPRYVYQRLSLATKLAPAARSALMEGKINIEGARLLSTTAAEIQNDILDRAEGDDGRIHVEDIRHELQGSLIAAEVALFDVAASGLETVELDDGLYFTDRKAALAAQAEAVKEKAKELRKKWSFVTILPVGQWFYQHEYVFNKTKAQGGGCVIQTDSYGEVTFHEGVQKRPKTEPKVFDQKKYEAEREKQLAADKAKRLQRHEELVAIVTKLPSDFPDGLTDPEGDQRTEDDTRPDGLPDCASGCKFRGLLEWSLPRDWHVCLNPNAARAGLLTFEFQSGGECFEAKK